MLESILNTYGYPAILVGTFLEGETILILGGVAAHLGYLSIEWVIACGFAGTLLGDQLYFYLGRRHGNGFLLRRPAWRARVRRVHAIIERYPVAMVLVFRFLYGLRTVTPFALGTSQLSYVLFSVLNIIGAGLWAGVVGLAGYFFGRGVEQVLGDIKRYEIELLMAVAAAGIVVWAVYWLRGRKPG